MRRVLLALAALAVFATPLPAQSLPAPACAALQALEQKYGSLNQGNDDQRREFALIVAEQFAFSFPGEGWGTKSADPGRPRTKDAVARNRGGALDGWDLVDGGSKRVTCSSHLDLAGQNFIPVTPRDHLGAPADPGPVQPPPPPPVADTSSDLQALKAAIEDLKAIVERAAFESHSTNEQLGLILKRPIEFPTYIAKIFGQNVTLTPQPK